VSGKDRQLIHALEINDILKQNSFFNSKEYELGFQCGPIDVPIQWKTAINLKEHEHVRIFLFSRWVTI